MRKLSISTVAPHVGAVIAFVVVTIFFFNPIFFSHKSLDQHDINEYLGTSQELREYRTNTGLEGLWASHVFSGMPAYLISVDWSDGPVTWVKRIGGLFLPHPVVNIFWAFLSFYVLLSVFKVRPGLAVAGAVAFGLSSYIIIGLGAGHNARVGAIAFMPLLLAGIHTIFSGKKLVGAGLTSLAMALHLRENHLQITYYLLLIVLVYGLVRLVEAWRQSMIRDFALSLAAAVVAVILAIGTFAGPLWAVQEYTPYSIRGKSELPGQAGAGNGLSKSYAFEYSNGLTEPMTLLIPNILGGSTMEAFVSDESSATYQALVSQGDNELANQLAPYTVKYFGDQSNTAPYYAGAVVVFLFVLGILAAEQRWRWWLVSIAVLGVVLSWGSNFAALNYFLFDYLPGYNKFRSVTFTLILVLLAMPLLGMLGLEKWLTSAESKSKRKQALWAFGITGGLCLLLWLTGGFGSLTGPRDANLPAWLVNALKEDRAAILRSDALRSFVFILIAFLALLADVPKRIGPWVFYGLLAGLILVDLVSFDHRYFGEEKYRRRADDPIQMTEADKVIKSDTSYHRVYNLIAPMNEARTSYFHHSLGGYHGAKLKRYQDLYDSCIMPETERLINDAQTTGLNFTTYPVLNMLNARYFVYGAEAGNTIQNPAALGPAWFVNEIRTVASPAEELAAVKALTPATVAVVDASKFPSVKNWTGTADSSAFVRVRPEAPSVISYSVQHAKGGWLVFSEIYYPKGWTATLDGKPADFVRANYVLRAMQVPAGRHDIRFTFAPQSYSIGNTITLVSSWLVLIGFCVTFLAPLRSRETPSDTTGKK